MLLVKYSMVVIVASYSRIDLVTYLKIGFTKLAKLPLSPWLNL